MCSIGRSENEHPSRAIRRDVAAKTQREERLLRMRADVSWQLRVRKSVDVTLKVTIYGTEQRALFENCSFSRSKFCFSVKVRKIATKGSDAMLLTTSLMMQQHAVMYNNPFYVFYKEYLILWTNSSRITNFYASRSLGWVDFSRYL